MGNAGDERVCNALDGRINGMRGGRGCDGGLCMGGGVGGAED